jgi:putative hydrolase of HD superfamily
MKDIINFLFEAGMLKKIPRSGYQFLGTGSESVAEHSFRVAIIAYVLARGESRADTQRTVLMSLFHDFHEARTGDHNYVNKRYVTVDEHKARGDLAEKLPFGHEIMALTSEFNSEETIEAQLALGCRQSRFYLGAKATAGSREQIRYRVVTICN